MGGVLLTVLLLFCTVAGIHGETDESVLGWDYLDPQQTPIEFSNRADDSKPVILISPIQPVNEVSYRLNETARALMYVIGVQVARLHNIAKKLGRPQGGVVDRMENAVSQMEEMMHPSLPYGKHRRNGASVAVSADENDSSVSVAASRRSGQPLPPPQSLEKRSAAASASASSSRKTSNSPEKKWSMPSLPFTTAAPGFKTMKREPTTMRNQKSVTIAPTERSKKTSTPARTVPLPVKKPRKPAVSSGAAQKNEKHVPTQKQKTTTSLPGKLTGKKSEPQKKAGKVLNSKPNKQSQHPVTSSPTGAQKFRAPVKKAKPSQSPTSMRPITRPKQWKPRTEEENSQATTPQPMKHPKKKRPSSALAIPSHGETSVAVSAGNGASVAVSAFRRSQEGRIGKNVRRRKRKGRELRKKYGKSKGRGKKKQKQKKNSMKNKRKRRNRNRGKGNKRSRVWYRRSARKEEIRKRNKYESEQNKPHSGSTAVSVSAGKDSASFSATASRRHLRHRRNLKRGLTTRKQRKHKKSGKKQGRGRSKVFTEVSRRRHRRRFHLNETNRRSAAVSVSASKGSASASASASRKRRRHKRPRNPDLESTKPMEKEE